MTLHTDTNVLIYGHKDALGDDPHGRIIEIDDETAALLDGFREEEFRHLGRYDVGKFVPIKDVYGVEWEVASAPCGAGCHCAAIIRQRERLGWVPDSI